MTSGPVNLNRFRKQKARAEKRARADANAAKHGRSKAEAQQSTAQEQKARRVLDLHRLDGAPSHADEDDVAARVNQNTSKE